MLILKNKILLAYAEDFTSFLIERADISHIKRIILFGSVARGEASKESDIDLFIDISRNNKSIETDIKRIKEDFIQSIRYQKYWLLKGIKNEINTTVGRLDEWKELRNSIIANGLILYSKFEEMPQKAVHKTILFWENVKPESKRVLLSKRLFGYKKDKKRYSGLLQQYDGERIGKGTLAVPSENAKIFLKLFKDMGITVKIKKVLEYK